MISLSIHVPNFANVAARTEKELVKLFKSGKQNIEKWMRLNKLKLNSKKSSLVIDGRSPN